MLKEIYLYVHKLKTHSIEGGRSLPVLILDHPENLRTNPAPWCGVYKRFS
jgi:hypothetical protein